MRQPAGQEAREGSDERWRRDKRWRRPWTGGVGVNRGNATTSRTRGTRGAIGNKSSSSSSYTTINTKKGGGKDGMETAAVTAGWRMGDATTASATRGYLLCGSSFDRLHVSRRRDIYPWQASTNPLFSALASASTCRSSTISAALRRSSLFVPLRAFHRRSSSPRPACLELQGDPVVLPLRQVGF